MSDAPRTVDYVRYERASGRIVATGKCRADRLASLASDTLGVIAATASDVRHYVDPESIEIVERAALALGLSSDAIAADGVAAAVIAGIPPGALCWIRGPLEVAPWVESSGQVGLTTNVAGTYVLTVDHPRYTVATVTIEAMP